MANVYASQHASPASCKEPAQSLCLVKTTHDGKDSPGVVAIDLGQDALSHLAVLSSQLFIPLIRGLAQRGTQPAASLTPAVAGMVADALEKFVAKSKMAKICTAAADADDAFSAFPAELFSNLEMEQYLGMAIEENGGPPTLPRETLVRLERGAEIWVSRLRQALSEQLAPGTPGSGGAEAALGLVAQWALRARRLDALRQELGREPAQNALRMLTLAGLPRANVVTRLGAELEGAAEEAACLSRHASALRPWLDRLAAGGPGSGLESRLQALVAVFRPLLAALRAFWGACPAARGAPQGTLSLLRAITEDVTHSARSSCAEGPDLLSLEGLEASSRLALTVHALGSWKSAYLESTARAARSVAGCWRFPPAAVFSGLDDVLHRAHQLAALVRMRDLFARLELLELGGPKGAELVAGLRAVQAAFADALSEGQEAAVVDLRVLQSDAETRAWEALEHRMRTLEAQVAAVISQALAGAASVAESLHLLECFEGWLALDTVTAQLAPRYLAVVRRDYG